MNGIYHPMARTYARRGIGRTVFALFSAYGMRCVYAILVLYDKELGCGCFCCGKPLRLAFVVWWWWLCARACACVNIKVRYIACALARVRGSCTGVA